MVLKKKKTQPKSKEDLFLNFLKSFRLGEKVSTKAIIEKYNELS